LAFQAVEDDVFKELVPFDGDEEGEGSLRGEKTFSMKF
jgi:hypothetical protein